MTYSKEFIRSPNFKPGRTQGIKYIVVHHWDDPAKKPKIEGVINHFKDPEVEVAAHYIVSGNRVIQMVKENDTAWHSRSANPYTIGIEVDPNTPGDTYKTVGELVRDIRSRHGDLPLKKHSDFVKTDCPGNLSMIRIDQEARNSQGEDMKPSVIATDKQIDDTINQARMLAGFPESDLDTFLKVYRPLLKNNYVAGVMTMFDNLIKDPKSARNVLKTVTSPAILKLAEAITELR